MLTQARVAVLVSGSGTNLQALLDAQQAGSLPSGQLCLVISDRPGVYALDRARQHHVEALAFDRASLGAAQTEAQMLAALAARGIDLVVLAGFLMILSPGFIRRYAGRIVNVHPSLLPAFGGKGYYGLRVHQAALARGVKVSGATVHLVTEEPDGGPILLQKAVRVYPKDTPETLQRRVMRQAEWLLLPRAVEELCRAIVKEDAHDQSIVPRG